MINILVLSIDKKYETVIFEQSDYVHFKGKTVRKNEQFNFNKFCNDILPVIDSGVVYKNLHSPFLILVINVFRSVIDN